MIKEYPTKKITAMFKITFDKKCPETFKNINLALLFGKNRVKVYLALNFKGILESFVQILFTVFCLALSIAGIIGCVVPALPGPPLNFAALLIIKFVLPDEITISLLIIFLVLTIAVTILDYYLPTFGAKRYGVSKYGVWGSLIGMVIGIFFFPPFGMILGIIIGAFVGELLAGKSKSDALRAGMVTFILSVAMMTVKLILSIVMTFYVFKAVV